MIRTTGLAALMLVAATGLAAAQSNAPAPAPQGQPPQMSREDLLKTIRLGAYNQLGLLEYCEAHGAVGPDIVALQRKVMQRLPGTPVAGEGAAESTGKTGVFAVGNQRVALEDVAVQRKTTVQDMCKQIADMMKQSAQNLPDLNKGN